MGRFRRLAGSEFRTDGAMKLKASSPTDYRPCLGIFKAAFSRIRGCMLFDMCRAKLKGKIYVGRFCSKEPRSNANKIHKMYMLRHRVSSL